MGLFKQMKQMKDVAAETPDLVRGAMEMQQAALDAQAGTGSVSATAPPVAGTGGPLDDEQMCNVSLARYAAICRAGSERGITDLAGIAAVAEEHGVSRADWDGAVAAWNARFAGDTPAAMRFNALWRGVG
jgi:hypothetical protein